MKKFIALLCMLTCVMGLTACGSADEMSTYQAEKVAFAEQFAVENIIPTMAEASANEALLDIYHNNGYTEEEWEAVVYNTYNITVEGSAFTKGIDSFLTAQETMGQITMVGNISSTVDDEEIIVYVDVLGEAKAGQVEIIMSNDYFGVVKSCTLNVEATFGELMTNAALNTLLGMGSVFAVLILIMAVISAFNFIPKIQAMFKKKEAPKAAPAPAAAPAPKAAAPAPVVEQADDLALVAVIAAAIAAYRGETSTDGFVVRSIKRAKRR